MHTYVSIVGNLTRDVELRYSNGGLAIGSSAIASTHKYTINGEKREDTMFIDITFFGKTAENANQYIKKGSRILIEGRLKFDQWTDNNGFNRSKHSVAVEKMIMLGDKNNTISQTQTNSNVKEDIDNESSVSDENIYVDCQDSENMVF